MTDLDSGPWRVRVTGDLWHGSIPAGAIYVGRGAPGLKASPFKNRHRVGACRCHTAGHADKPSSIIAFARDLEDNPALVTAARRDLTGRDLACWCEGPPCHGDILLLVVAGADPLDALRQLGLEEDGA
jgi:Domain of unknown function (DUF4326)